MTDFLKLRKSAPDGFFAAEAAGLRWLAEPGVVPIVDVIDHGVDFLRLGRLDEVGPSAEAAASFGRKLARLHDAGAPGFGWSPAPQSFFGPLDNPFEVRAESVDDFTGYWVEQRLRPLVTAIAGDLTGEDRAMVVSATDAIASGAFAGICGEGEEAPARVHGDLWAGNLMW
ncbi:MAG: fructosamine kinase family protein, partial [Brevibacterium linens]